MEKCRNVWIESINENSIAHIYHTISIVIKRIIKVRRINWSTIFCNSNWSSISQICPCLIQKQSWIQVIGSLRSGWRGKCCVTGWWSRLHSSWDAGRSCLIVVNSFNWYMSLTAVSIIFKCLRLTHIFKYRWVKWIYAFEIERIEKENPCYRNSPCLIKLILVPYHSRVVWHIWIRWFRLVTYQVV
jgi:hypothetical protein